MAKPALSKQVIAQFSSREWRLNHLYQIEDAYGKVVQFRLNAAQKRLLDDMHFLNLILKARQMGFSTFILVMALDCCLWNDHFAAGLIADTMVNAMNLLKRVKFAYEHMPEQLQKLLPLKSDNQTGMEFANGSSISVGVSLRSGTFNFIHISEYGKICAKTPDKASEIKSGSLNTLAPRQLAFIESTAEGKGGDFYDKTKLARKLIDAKRDPSELEYKFHFFPWFEDPKYTSAQPFALSMEETAYFNKLTVEHGIHLKDGQKWWYAAKHLEQGDGMLKEFPSTPDEAFEGAMEGAVYGGEIRKLRLRGKIGPFPYVPGIAVNTFWDFGVGDAQSIWLHQEVAGEHNFIGYYENSNEPLAHYWDWLTNWRVMRSAVWGVHKAPHDVDHRRQGATQIQTLKQMAAGIGLEFETVERTPLMKMAIMNLRSKLPGCNFDEQACSVGVEHLENYAYEWNDKFSVWSSEPRHDEHSHAEAAMRTFSDGYTSPYTGSMPQSDWQAA